MKPYEFKASKTDWLQDVISMLPADTADLDRLLIELPKLSARGLAALADALTLLIRREGK